jgi:hypothetical protein
MFSSLLRGRSRPITIVLSAFAALAIAGTTIALGAARYRTVVNPNTTVSYTANTTGAVVGATQNGTGDAMEGIVGNSAGAIGILGFATDLVHPEVALEGLAWGPSSVGLYGQGLKNPDTTHPTVGLLGTSSSGIGVEGQSLVAAGTGVFGTASDGLSSGSLGIGGASGALGTSSRGVFLEPGVEGESTTSGSEDTAGAFGLSAYVGGHQPSHGVLGYGANAAVFCIVTGSGASSTNAAVEGLEFFGSSGFPDFNAGVLGKENYGTGILAEGGGSSPSRVGSTFSEGLYVTGGNQATSSSYAVGEEVEATDENTDAIFGFNAADGRFVDVLPGGNTLLFEGAGGGGNFNFDVNGNETLTGLIFTAGACSGGCSKPHTPGGKRVITYAAQSSEPTVEDYGEGRIVGGVGQIALDPAFARTIDTTHSYLVFLTPEGDNRGLYVTQRTATGFTVRESQGGSSTLSIMYRIVAKPYGVTAARLPMVDLGRGGNPQAGIRGRHVSQPLEPYQALVKAVGKERAAQILAQFKANYDARLRMLKALPHADANGTLHMGTTSVAPARINN